MPTINNKHFTIIGGAGAVGSYFTYMMNNKGFNIIAIVRPDGHHSMAVLHLGLTLITSEGNKTVPSTVFRDNYEHSTKQDIIIITQKQPHLNAELIEEVLSIVSPGSIIGVIGNGLPFYFLESFNLQKHHLESIDPEGLIVQQLNGRCVIGISPLIAANIVANGVTKINRPLDKISVDIGIPNGSKNCNNSDIKNLAELMNEVGIKTAVKEPGIHLEILKKEQFAITANVLSAIANKTLGEVFYGEDFQSYIRYGVEIVNLVSTTLPIGPLRSFNEMKALPITTGHYSSMCRDINEKKNPEIKAIVNSLIEVSETLGFGLYLKPLYTAKEYLELRMHEQTITPDQLMTLADQSNEAIASLYTGTCNELHLFSQQTDWHHQC